MKVVQVEWLDSVGMTPEWEYKDEVKSLKPVSPTSVGFLLEDEPDHVTILQTDSENQLLGRLTIPKISITSMKNLDVVSEISKEIKPQIERQ
jgi:hypothetical protein